MNPIEQLQRQKQLLQIEYRTEKEAYRQQTQNAGIDKKVAKGDAWFPLLIVNTYFNAINQYCIEVIRQDCQGKDHKFEFGKPVVFFSINDDDKNKKKEFRYFSFTGTVSYVDGDKMVVVVPEEKVTELKSCLQPIGVQLFFDETSYRIMFDALDRVINATNGRLAYLRDLFYTRRPAEVFTFRPLHFDYLNDSQSCAVNSVLWAKDVEVIQGPPGTGKTTTLVEAINETLKRETQILVCAQSNMAVDWISEKLVDRGINVLRIGNPSRVNDKMLGYTYERRFADHPDYGKLWQLRRNLRQLRRNRKNVDERFHQKTERLKSRITELEIRINADIFGEARVVACTLTGSASRLLYGMKFSSVFIDEAAQAMEAACWIPVRRANRVILAGDHCQLPPTVKSLEAMKGGLGKSLMERIIENKPQSVVMLDTQYRMNDDLMRFSSNYFYNGKLKSAPQVSHRSILDYDYPIAWVDTSDIDFGKDEKNYREQYVSESFSRVNKREAELTMNVLQNYFMKIGKERILDESIDVGIISPYAAQVQYLKKLVKKYAFFRPFRHLITVSTVDGFQGQERNIIMISMVRSNKNHNIGFLEDLRRMNVAITRAQMKLIILGDSTTLTAHPFYKKLYDYIQELHCKELEKVG